MKYTYASYFGVIVKVLETMQTLALIMPIHRREKRVSIVDVKDLKAVDLLWS